jgi:hypothetical protein
LPQPGRFYFPFSQRLRVRLDWLQPAAKLKRGVRRYRQRSGRIKGVRLTPLCVVPDGASSLLIADLQ